MTIEVLIHAIVRQTTILIAQLATSRGIRAPLAQIADQVFLDLVRELERQGVSRKVSADMFGMGLRTYRRKIQRLAESSTERGRSLWEIVLEYIREHGLVTRLELLNRFSRDDEAQIRAVLRDLSASQLIFSAGSGQSTSYRATSDEEFATLQQRRGSDGLDELVVALMYREGPLTRAEIASKAQIEESDIAGALERLVASGRIERTDRKGAEAYRAGALVIPLGAPAGWEAAVFDHFKALVATVLCRLGEDRTTPVDQVGGSTYTIDVWDGHPLADEVLGTLSRMRASLSELRARVAAHNETQSVPDPHSRVVIYAGQYVIEETHETSE
jgi:DNA-binding MarR family transcriptional regulator